MNIEKYYQPSPDINEGIPEKIERNKDVMACKKQIMDKIQLTFKGPVLNIGPACGWETKHFLDELGYKTVDAITLFGSEYKEIKKNAPESNVCVGDMHEMPDEWSDRYGLVFASHVLEHSPAPFIALSEMARVAEPGGIVFIVLPDPNGYTGLGNPHPKRIGDFAAHLFCGSIETVIEMARHTKKLNLYAYHEVPQYCEGLIHYYNRVFIFKKV